MKQPTRHKTQNTGGFTLIEILAAMAVLVILVLALGRVAVEATSISKWGMTALMRNSTAEVALESLLQDAEGMAVNERLACYVEADVCDAGGFGFDEIYFVTTAGDQDDSRAYQLVHYFVTNSVLTNAIGEEYVNFRLIRGTRIFAVADSRGTDVMSANLSEREWWDRDIGGMEENVLADNVVRFDIYCLGWDGDEWMGNSLGKHVFASTDGPNVSDRDRYKNMAPAAFDVYLQVTSHEVAQEAGMALVDNNISKDIQLRARETMIKESASYIGRASPIIGAAQLHHPVIHYQDP